jgi:hypothetical protein
MLAKIGGYFVIIDSNEMAYAFSDKDEEDEPETGAENFAGWLAQEIRSFLPYVKRVEPVKGALPSGKKSRHRNARSKEIKNQIFRLSVRNSRR